MLHCTLGVSGKAWVLLNDGRNGGKFQLNRETVRRASTEQEKPEQVSHQLLSVNAELCYLY